MLLRNFLEHGYLAVDIFFALSGFVLCISSVKTFKSGVDMPGYKSFMYKRFCRIFPLYIVMTIVYHFSFPLISFANFLVDFTLLQGMIPFLNANAIPPGWSLTNEWIIYFLFPIAFSFVLRKNLYKWLIPTAIAFLLIVCMVRGLYLNWANYKVLKDLHGFNPIISETRGPISFLRTMADYALGIFAYFIYTKGIKTNWLGFIVIPSFLLLFWPPADFLIIMLLPAVILYITNENGLSKLLSSKPVHFLGLISYSLYINHYLFIYSYKYVSGWTGINNNWFSVSYVVFCTIALSSITFYIIEKPALEFLRKRFVKKGEPQPVTVKSHI